MLAMLILMLVILMLLNLNTGYADTDADLCIRIMSLCCIRHRVKMHHLFKNLFYSQVWIRQTKYIVMMTKEGSTKIINFMTPREGFLYKVLAILVLSIYSTLIAFILKGYNAAFLCYC